MSRARTDCLAAVIGELVAMAATLRGSESEIMMSLAVVLMERARGLAQGAAFNIAAPEAIAYLRNAPSLVAPEDQVN